MPSAESIGVGGIPAKIASARRANPPVTTRKVKSRIREVFVSMEGTAAQKLIPIANNNPDK